MNGRVYDPLTAQFYSPDPFVQAPDNWLNYNRYGYCLNNPLKYTDPSRYYWDKQGIWHDDYQDTFNPAPYVDIDYLTLPGCLKTIFEAAWLIYVHV